MVSLRAFPTSPLSGTTCAMELTPEQQAILAILREHGIQDAEYLSVQTLDRERSALPQPDQEKWASALKGLVNGGLIARDPLGYGLTKSGRYLVYPPSD